MDGSIARPAGIRSSTLAAQKIQAPYFASLHGRIGLRPVTYIRHPDLRPEA